MFRFAWVSAEGLGDDLLAIAPWGDVLAYDSGTLRLLARQDGSVLDSAKPGRWLRALGFIDERTAVMVAMDGTVTEVRFPGMAMREVFHAEQRVDAAAVQRGKVALGTTDGRLLVLAAPSYAKQLDVAPDNGTAGVTSVALSANGSTAAATVRDGGTHTYHLEKGVPVGYIKDELQALSLSASGELLFGKRSSEATVIDVYTGEVVREYPSLGWINDTQFVDGATMVAVGHWGGLQLFHPGRGEPEVLEADQGARKVRGESRVATSHDHGMICGSDSDGRVACFSTKRLEQSRYQPAPSLVGEPWK